jgi:glycosyltransferase involved in cell wall biosynthesis
MIPSVSIVMVVKNERANLQRSFGTLSRQAFLGLVEFVVVDSGSTDGTVEFLRDHGIEPIQIPPQEFHHGKTRNLAAENARNEILVFLSGDALPVNEQWLAKLIEPFADPRVGGVYGRQAPPPGMGLLRAHAIEHEYPQHRMVRDIEKTRQNKEIVHPGLFRFSNVNSAVRREVWKRFPFDETLLLAEDQGMCRDILLNAGMVVVYEPEAAVVHGHERAPRGELQFAFENGFSLTRMGILRNPEIGGEMGYGLRRVRDDLQHFLAKGKVGLALASFGINGLKWLGVQLGKREKSLPLWLVKRISPGAAKLPR